MLKKNILLMISIGICFIFFSNSVVAHVPYLEHCDYSIERPCVVRKMVTQSKAFYSWLETDYINPCKDYDVYELNIKRKVNMYVELIVPVIEDYYEDFVPWFALVGPGLPDPGPDFPFNLSEGYGAIVKENVAPGEPRETFPEPFGNKSYYKGPIFEEKLETTGTYYVYVWDPYESGGDYTLVIGKLEIWGPLDILRALIYTPLIRRGKELHTPE